MTKLLCVFVTSLALAQTGAAAQTAIVIRIAGDASPDLRRGIELGIEEASQTARLLHREVTLTDDSSAAPTAIIVASSSAPIPAGEAITRVHVAPLPSGAEACEFSVAGEDPKAGGKPVLWHPTLAKYGASELNERFEKKFGTRMTDAAYAGWVAVKALAEAALRQKAGDDYCRTLASLRFDGHKGRPLFFDPKTRTLSQPVYLVKNGTIVGETK